MAAASLIVWSDQCSQLIGLIVFSRLQCRTARRKGLCVASCTSQQPEHSAALYRARHSASLNCCLSEQHMTGNTATHCTVGNFGGVLMNRTVFGTLVSSVILPNTDSSCEYIIKNLMLFVSQSCMSEIL